MAFTERLQTIDRRVAYGAALVIALGGLASACDTENVDPSDTTTWKGMSTHERDSPYATSVAQVDPATFNLQVLNLVDAPQQ